MSRIWFKIVVYFSFSNYFYWFFKVYLLEAYYINRDKLEGFRGFWKINFLKGETGFLQVKFLGRVLIGEFEDSDFVM